MGDMGNAYNNNLSVAKPERKRPLETTKRK
jgi:hypothetical protein